MYIRLGRAGCSEPLGEYSVYEYFESINTNNVLFENNKIHCTIIVDCHSHHAHPRSAPAQTTRQNKGHKFSSHA